MTDSELSVSVLLDPVVIPKPPVSPRQEFDYSPASPLSIDSSAVTADSRGAGDEAGCASDQATVDTTVGYSSLARRSRILIDELDLEAGRVGSKDAEASMTVSAGGVYVIGGSSYGRRASDDLYGSPPELPSILQQINDFALENSLSKDRTLEELSPKSRERMNSEFLRTGMDPRDVPFWPNAKTDSSSVDLSKPEQDLDLVLLLKQIIEGKRQYPLDYFTFREYNAKHFSEESIDFLFELSKVRRKIETAGDSCISDLMSIYDKYIKTQKPVSISREALRQIENKISEESLEIRDFHLANREICVKILRGPYMRDFLKENLKNDNANEVKADRIIMTISLISAIVSYIMVIFHSYWFLFLGLFFVWWFFFTFQRTTLHICPVLALWIGGVRLRPSGQFWHCLYKNVHLQEILDSDVLEAQRKSAKRQLAVSSIVSIVLSLLFGLLRYNFF